MFRICRKYLFIALALLGLIWIIISKHWPPLKTFLDQYPAAPLPTLPSILDSAPARGKSIFFIESSYKSIIWRKITLTARQACAIESAAFQNPNFEVYVLFALPRPVLYNETDGFLQAITSYRNVRLRHVDMGKYFQGTPVENLWTSGKIERSHYVIAHRSDILRLLTLWKYGGIYLDLDVVVLKSFETLPQNCAGAESEKNVANGVLSFGAEDDGHEFLQSCLMSLKDGYRGDDWGHNGPALITRLLRPLCGAETAIQMQEKTCGDSIKVLPKEAFYPVPWEDWKLYFNEHLAQIVFNVSKNSYLVHVWNKHSAHKKVLTHGKSAYATYAQKFCPKVLAACGAFF